MGVRSYVGVIPTVGCVNEVVGRIAKQIDGGVPILHHQGCCQLKPDLEMVTRVLIGFGRNPNISSVLLVSLGCESVNAEEVEEQIGADKPVKRVCLQELGGITKTVRQGVRMAQEMALDSLNGRCEAELSELIIGIKCGASDTTSGIASNPAIGVAADRLLEEGATVIFGETTEVIGAEHILARRAKNEEVANRILEKVRDMEERAKLLGADMRGGQPTAGNIRGGLTTIEEKSLGAIVKAGTKPIEDVLEYGERPQKPGLYFMDSPGREMEFLAGLASAGAQIMLFSTGLGAPQGFPFCPVIKVSANPDTCKHLKEHIDVDLSKVVKGEEEIEEAGNKIFEEVIEVASGKKVKAELSNYDRRGVNSNIYVIGPII